LVGVFRRYCHKRIKKAHKQWLQQNTEESKYRYKEKRNHAKTINREADRQSWDKFVSNIEGDLHGRQIFAYKVIKHLNKSEKDTVRINVI
jgi:hypothetical protein